MKKLTFLIGCLTSGGAEHQLSILCNLLVEKYDVTIVTWVDFEDHYSLDPRIKRVCLAPQKNKCYKLFSIMWHMFRCKTDVVISFLSYANILALVTLLFRRKIKSIVSERNYRDMEGTWMEFLLYRFLYRRATYIVPNSYSQGIYISKKTKLGNKVKIITNYTDINQYSATPMKEHLPVKIGVFCRYVPEKNYLRFAQAVAIAKAKTRISFEVDWFGKKYVYNTVSKYYDEFSSNIKELSLEETIHLHDHISNVAERMREFDVICLMSLREGFSNVISEAICSARPVLASNVSDNSVMVHDGINGYLVNPLDVDSMANGIIKFVNLSFEIKQKMGLHSRRIAEKLFDAAQFRDRYVDLIEH